MKAALCIHRIADHLGQNLATVLEMSARAAGAGADLVLFAEAALSGLFITDDPAHDLPLGQAVPGPGADRLAAAARDHRIWLVLGILERAADQLYDAALLFAPDGRIVLHYRRIRPHWHSRHADPAVYCQGSELGVAETPFGQCAFLICGDLFGDALIQQVRAQHVDLLLVPIARDFDEDVPDLAPWHRHEKYAYAQRALLASVPMLLTNYLADYPGYGGAFGAPSPERSWPNGRSTGPAS